LPARSVILSSASHWTGAMHWDDLQLAAPGAYDGIVAYDQSKLTIALVTFELARRLEGAGVTAVCFDPDDIDTKLLREGRPELSAISIVHGATTSVHLASSPDAEGPTGVYFEDGRETRPDAEGPTGVYFEDGRETRPLEAVLDRGAQRRIWAEVERLSGRLRV